MADTIEKVKRYESHFLTIAGGIATTSLVAIVAVLISMKSDLAVVKSKLPEIIQTQETVRQLSERTALVEQAVYMLQNDDRRNRDEKTK